MVAEPPILVLFLSQMLHDLLRLNLLGLEVRMNILESVGELVVLVELLTRRLAVVIFDSLGQEVLEFLIPDGASLVILLTDVNWRHLADKIFSRHDPENDLIFEIFFFSHLELDFFSDKVVWVVALPIRLLAYGHHGLHIVDLSRLLVLDHGAAQGCRPDIESGVVLADALLPSILHPVVDAVGAPYLLDDRPSVLNVAFEVARFKIENYWLLIEQVFLI
jgi:hypothetical protein